MPQCPIAGDANVDMLEPEQSVGQRVIGQVLSGSHGSWVISSDPLRAVRVFDATSCR